MADNTILTVLGRKGSGKTTLVKELIAEYPRVVVFDWIGEYELEPVAGAEEAANALVRAASRKRFQLSLRVPQREDILRCLHVAGALTDALLVVEEASTLCSPSYLPDELANLVRYGRHRELSQCYVARRPSELNRDLTAQSDLIVSFHQHEPRDLEYLRAAMGPGAVRASSLAPYRVIVGGDVSKAPLAVLERMDLTSGKETG